MTPDEVALVNRIVDVLDRAVGELGRVGAAPYKDNGAAPEPDPGAPGYEDPLDVPATHLNYWELRDLEDPIAPMSADRPAAGRLMPGEPIDVGLERIDLQYDTHGPDGGL